MQQPIRFHRLTDERLLLACSSSAGRLDRPWGGFEGTAAPEGLRCEAESVSKGSRCPKVAVVLLFEEGYEREGSSLGERIPIALCGGHFDVHRRGKPVRLPER